MRFFYFLENNNQLTLCEIICFIANNMRGISVLREIDFTIAKGLKTTLYSVEMNSLRASAEEIVFRELIYV